MSEQTVPVALRPGLSILLVEDNPGDARLIREMLREAQWNGPVPDHVDTLAAAIGRLAARAADVVLLDLNLPDSRGLDTLHRLLEAVPGLPVVVLTGCADEQLGAAAVQAGAQDYLVKDRVDGPLLTHCVRYAHERQRMLLALQESKRQEREAAERLQAALVSTIEAIAMTVEKRDPYTAGHQRRVARIAVAIGRAMGLEQERLQGLRLGGLVHDIGKIYVPSEILVRPGRLSPLEMRLVREHTVVGYDILANVEAPWPVARMARQHHERLDGSGYPDGLAGEAILLEARILAVADVIEAMSSHRPYRPAVGLDAALAEIERGTGTAYDPQVASTALWLIREQRLTWE